MSDFEKREKNLTVRVHYTGSKADVYVYNHDNQIEELYDTVNNDQVEDTVADILFGEKVTVVVTSHYVVMQIHEVEMRIKEDEEIDDDKVGYLINEDNEVSNKERDWEIVDTTIKQKNK